jgi:hypothetical protein
MNCLNDPSLVLYVPLYELDGSPVISKDSYGHLCTVTGAQWTPTGRNFDGINNKILTLTIPAFALSSSFTIEMWVNLDVSVPAQHQWGVEISHGGGERLGLCARRNITGNRVGSYNTVTSAWTMADSALTPGAWCHSVAVFVVNDKEYFYLNGQSDGSPGFTAIPVWTGGTAEVYIGNNAASNPLKGLIGEVRIYNRPLTLLETRQNFLATKWRYR